MSSDEESILRDLTKIKGITELWDSQKESIKAGLLSDDRNFVIIAPTASGKTLISKKERKVSLPCSIKCSANRKRRRIKLSARCLELSNINKGRLEKFGCCNNYF